MVGPETLFDGTRTHSLWRGRRMIAALPQRVSASYVVSRSLVRVPVSLKNQKKLLFLRIIFDQLSLVLCFASANRVLIQRWYLKCTHL
jgi:hypothetical protein